MRRPDDYDRDNHYTGDDDIHHADYIDHITDRNVDYSYDDERRDAAADDERARHNDADARDAASGDQAEASRQRESASTQADSKDASEAL